MKGLISMDFKEIYDESQIMNEISNSMTSSNENTVHFTEMAVHCLAKDNYGIIVTVGSSIDSNKANGSKKEHNPPHAHVWTVDKKYHSRFQIINEKCPTTPEELQTVNEKDAPLSKVADKLIKWANAKPKRCFTEGDKNNWDAMRNSWRDIQEIVNEGLANPTII